MPLQPIETRRLYRQIADTAPMFDGCDTRKMRSGVWAASVGVVLFGAGAGQAIAGGPPAGFTRLADVAPEIKQDMRYAGANNFTGHPVPGYGAPRCWLRATRACCGAADAASNPQQSSAQKMSSTTVRRTRSKRRRK